MTLNKRSKDFAGGPPAFLLYWGLPIAAMVIDLGFGHPAKTLIWLAALSWMGGACLINARRCGRVHCYYTGPFFLIMIVPVALHGFQWLSLGPDGWQWLGITIGVGGVGIWWISEKIRGKFV